MEEIMEMTNEQKCVLLELSAIIAENNKKEQEAVQGYTEQLKVIHKAKEVFANDFSAVSSLDELEAETREKIADELNHSDSLNKEYTDLTGIEPMED